MYDAYSRALPESRMLALARLIPITPRPVTIASTEAVITISIVENPRPLRFVCLLAFMCIIVMVQRNLWSKSMTTAGPLSNRGATKLLWTKNTNVRVERLVELTELQSEWFEFGYGEVRLRGALV